MVALWQHHDLESLEAISQNDGARRILLKMATLSQHGKLPQFLDELAIDPEIDDEVKGTLTELALDRTFLLTVEDYLRRTQRFHGVRPQVTIRYADPRPRKPLKALASRAPARPSVDGACARLH